MVRALLTAIGKEVRGIHQAAYVLAGFALLSQLLALVRDRLLAGSFGASQTLDVYYAAFRLPDLLFATVASLLSLYALLPVLSRLEKEEEVVGFIRESLVVFFVVMGALSGVLYIYAPVLIPLIAPGASTPELVLLTRILLLQPILLGASNIIAALTQMKHRFILYSISPLLYNLGIIVGLMAFYPHMGTPGLGWGVVLGALLHMGIQVPFLLSGRGEYSFGATLRRLRGVLFLSVPRTLALAAGQFMGIVLIAFASLMDKGSIAVLSMASNLQAVPLTIIGVSYSVAAFPTLSRLHASGEQNEFVRHVTTALRHILFWAIPATVFVIVLRAHLVRAILGTGAFDWEATRLTAAALALFVVALCAQSVTLLIARGYYAAGKTGKPLLFAVISLCATALLAWVFVQAFAQSSMWHDFFEALLRVSDIPGTSVLMLALAGACGALVQAGFGLWHFARDFALPLRPFSRLVFQSFSASVLGGATAYALLASIGSYFDIDTVAGVVGQGVLAGIGGFVVTITVLWLLKNEEFGEALRALHSRLSPSPVVLETTDVQS